MIEIRKATEADAPSLAEFNHVFNGVNRASEQIGSVVRTGTLTGTETVLVAEQSGAIVGFVCLQTLHSFCYDSPWTEITELFVTPNHRRCGVGKSLVREAIRYAEQYGASEVLLRTNVKNEAAKSLCTIVGLKQATDVVFHSSIKPA